jgi:HNH endonuclease
LPHGWGVIEYRPILGFPDYLINNRGEITSTKSGRPKPRKSSYNRDGYKVVRISNPDGQWKQFLVSRLVLETFVGPCPEGHQTRHLNSIRDDNRVENLVWGTYHENYLDKVERGTQTIPPHKIGENNGSSVLTQNEVLDILKSTDGCVALSKKYNVGPSAISAIKTGVSWKHLNLAKK